MVEVFGLMSGYGFDWSSGSPAGHKSTACVVKVQVSYGVLSRVYV